MKRKPCHHCTSLFWSEIAHQKFCETCIPPGNRKAKQLMANYRIAWPEYTAMYFEQNGQCLICKVWEACSVDHDRTCCGSQLTCGKCVRGLICQGCNINLGRLENGTIPLPESKISAYLFGYLE